MFRILGRFANLVLILAVIACLAAALAYSYVHWPKEHPTVLMTINAGTSLRDISEVLEKGGVIRCAFCFRIHVALRGVSSRLRAGDYEFPSGLTESEVVSKLLKGDFRTYRFTIPEGWTVEEIAAYLQTAPFVGKEGFADEFLRLSKDEAFIKGLGIGWDVANLEGYLYPSTYEVYRLTDSGKLLAVMAGEFKRRFADSIRQKGEALGLSPAEIVTLASIVEKETGKAEERPLVASVLLNRLKLEMPLQSDPTVIYGLPEFDGNLRKRDLANTHKYNTYVHPGLPPGPICNPGEAAIKAVLMPADSKYLYFVSRNDGTHQFSERFEDHQKAVVQYQKLPRE